MGFVTERAALQAIGTTRICRIVGGRGQPANLLANLLVLIFTARARVCGIGGYIKKLYVLMPGCGRSVGIVRLRSKTTEFLYVNA
jgi:hypothetical protein